MRYLNKIVFINSANIAYAEIGIAGNVHFIGTQGVGKSTILRAILFFYNADKLKLGIEKGKRSFDDYYFPHGNSFIVYEVATETGIFCVMAYRSQGRVAFRFIDGAYNSANFISTEHKAMAWEQIRNTFAGTSSYSRKVERYEEYRDILYGNNKGLPLIFRKYALIESRQYQNLPRTIQNVFLNSKLEAEFIKQTIIMSLNEENVRIDLNQYALHLKNFEQQLSDITKWSEKNRSGEIVVRLLADKIAKLYTEVRFLEQEKLHLVQSLVDTHQAKEEAHPAATKKLDADTQKLAAAREKVQMADQKYFEKKAKINKEITLLDARITEARRKTDEYGRLNILGIINRVGKKSEWENKKSDLQAERNLLASRYQEITNKYEALVLQLQNQLDNFTNAKNKAGNDRKELSYLKKDELNSRYAKIIAGIEHEHSAVKANAESLLDTKKDFIHQLELKKREIELRRWFETEIATAKKAIADADHKLSTVKSDKSASKAQIESLQKHWELDVAKSEVDYANKRSKINDQVTVAKGKIDYNKDIIASSRNSLFEWLHENKPGWETTIGKVVDQRSVLFNSGLSPKIVSPENNLLYGVELDLSAVASEVRSIADYEDEIQQLNTNIAEYELSLTALAEEQARENDKYKKKYQPQIKTLKDLISVRDYEEEKATNDRQAAILEHDDWIRKAESEQKAAVKTIKEDIENAKDDRQKAEDKLLDINKNIKKQTEDKRKEKDTKINAENKELLLVLQNINTEIITEKERVQKRIVEIDNQSKKDLEAEGADVVRITGIEKELLHIDAELDYIELNRDKVVEYKKDKRELFDKVDDYKADKKREETKLLAEQQKFEAAKVTLEEEVLKWTNTVSVQQEKLREIDEDLAAFDEYSTTDTFQRLTAGVIVQGTSVDLNKRLTLLISTIAERVSDSTYRMNDLHSTVSRFLSNFSSNNIFGFETNLIDDEEYLRFAESLSEFLEENKIAEYEKRTNEHFASLIFQVGKETTELVSKEAIISKVINDINRDFEERNFAGVIKSINLRLSPSANKIVTLLQEIRIFNNEYASTLGAANLFSTDDTTQSNKRAVSYLKSFADEISSSKQNEVTLSDSFELEFRIVENENDSGWVEKLTNVGSEGTDVLVKAMINIMLLNVFKESASKRFKDFRLHCMMDEIGKLHPNNVKGILKFANDRNIVLINSSPTSYNAVDYKHTYLLAKDSKHTTTIKRLITNHIDHGIEQGTGG